MTDLEHEPRSTGLSPRPMPTGRRGRWPTLVTGLGLVAASVMLVGTVASAADGALDDTFDDDGKVTASLGQLIYGTASTFDSQDQLVVAATDVGTKRVLVSRFRADGSLDPDYGTGGTTNAGTGAALSLGDDIDLVLDSQERAVVAATVDSDVFLMRLDTDGQLDSSFGANGTVRTGLGANESVVAVDIDDTGRLIAVGSQMNPTSGLKVVLVLRYDSDGNLDTTFDSDGWVTHDLSALTASFTINTGAVDPRGRVVIGGDLSGSSALIRLHPDGSLDTAFGVGGVATLSATNSGHSIHAVTFDSQDRIVVGGVAADQFYLGRVLDDGTPDVTFDGDGSVTIDPTPDNGSDANVIRGVALDQNRAMVAGGGRDPHGGFPGVLSTVRYRADGTLDTAFGTAGIATADFGVSVDGGALAMDATGNIVLSGHVTSPGTIALARFTGSTPPLDLTSSASEPSTLPPPPPPPPTTLAPDTTSVPATTAPPSTTSTSSTTTPFTPSTSPVGGVPSTPSREVIAELPVANLVPVTAVLNPGSDIVVTVEDSFIPGETVVLIVASEPRVIATTTADDNGSVALTGSIPEDLDPGSHTLAAIGLESGEGRRQAIEVASLTLPATGWTTSPTFPALGAIALGALTIWVTRRRIAPV